MSKFRMLTRWYRVESSSCRLNHIPLVPKLRLPLLRRHFVGFPRFTCDCVPIFHGFVRAACTYDSLRLFPIYLHNLRDCSSVPSGNDALRFGDLGLLDGRALSDVLSRPATAKRLSESSPAPLFLAAFFLSFSVDSSCRITPHVQKDFPFALCLFANFALKHFVDNRELCEVTVSLYTVQLL